MGVAERRPLPHERLGGVGREEQRVGGRLRHPLAVDLEPADEHGESVEREPDVATGGEHGRLVLLQVAVVRERETLHGREQARQPTDRRAGLAAGELGDVRVQLLRHHRGARRRGLREPREAELRRRPEHDLLADARKVDEEHRGRVEVVEREVAIRDRVDRVAHLARRLR